MDSSLFNNPLFQNLSPEKLQFLMEFQNAQKTSDPNSAAPLFMNAMNQAQDQGIRFEQNESSLLIRLLMQNMSEAERKKAELLLMLLKNKK